MLTDAELDAALHHLYQPTDPTLTCSWACGRGSPTRARAADPRPGGASRATIVDRLITLTGTGGDVVELKNNIQIFLVGNIVAFFVIVAVVIGGAVLLFRRQKRRVAHYEARIADSASRAAQLAI